MKKILFLLLPLAIVAFSPSQIKAQSLENSSWFQDDDEEEEETTLLEDDSWDIGPGKMDEVSIRLNGEAVELTEEFTFYKKDTLDIQVRHLKPGSPVVLHVKKGGIKLKRTSFYANEKGQLDLEVRTGNKKVSGAATIYYTPSSGRKKEREARISIE